MNSKGEYMDFSKALEALKDNKKVTRKSSRALGNGKHWIEFVNVVVDGKFEAKSFFIINYGMSHCKFLPCDGDLLADDWEIVPDTQEITSDEVLSEFKAWLEHAINSSRGTPGNGNSYLIQCMDALNYLSKSKRVQRCTPEECTVLSINNTQLVANTVSGEYVIVQLPGVKL